MCSHMTGHTRSFRLTACLVTSLPRYPHAQRISSKVDSNDCIRLRIKDLFERLVSQKNNSQYIIIVLLLEIKI